MAAAQTPNCLFCRIVAGDMAATLVHEGDRTIAFRDINPQAPTHLLVVPREHFPDVATLATADPALLADVVRVAASVAATDGVTDYRLVFNTGRDAGQSVFHVHGHVLGGRRMGWPPG